MKTKFDGPRGIKTQNFGLGVPCPKSGNCKFCHEWESELDKNGYCADEKCKRGRLLWAYAEGKAIMIYEDCGKAGCKAKVFK